MKAPIYSKVYHAEISKSVTITEQQQSSNTLSIVNGVINDNHSLSLTQRNNHKDNNNSFLLELIKKLEGRKEGNKIISGDSTNQQPGKFEEEIAKLKAEDKLAEPKRAANEAREDARVLKAVAAEKAEQEAEQEAAAVPAPVKAPLVRDANGIPLPPPMKDLSNKINVKPKLFTAGHGKNGADKTEKNLIEEKLISELHVALARRNAGPKSSTSQWPNKYLEEINKSKEEYERAEPEREANEARENARVLMEEAAEKARQQAEKAEQEAKKVAANNPPPAPLVMGADGTPIPPPLPI